MKLLRRQFLHLAAGAATLPTLLRSALAQTYPTRPPWRRESCGHCCGLGCWSTAAKGPRTPSSRSGTTIARPHRLIGCSRSMSKRILWWGPVTDETIFSPATSWLQIRKPAIWASFLAVVVFGNVGSTPTSRNLIYRRRGFSFALSGDDRRGPCYVTKHHDTYWACRINWRFAWPARFKILS
jgi:hypothetical protein